jgi:Sap, sulfolipid-1-addressing protein
MGGFLAILPLTIVMVAGPQIISAVFLATSLNWQRNSIAYVTGAAFSITLFVTVFYLLANEIKGGGDDEASGSTGDWMDIAVLVLLLVAMVYVFLNRKTAEPPKWMGKLQEASPGFSLKLGALLLGVFPTDIITTFTVGTHLAREGNEWVDALPFIGLTLLWLALPALLVVLLGHRAKEFLPKVRDWMNTNSWIVSEVVIVFFIVLTINSLAD